MPEQPVLIAAGGTGGHVYPALAIARALQEQNVPVCWVGTEKGIEARVVPEARIDLVKVRVSGIRGKGLIARLSALADLVFSTGQCVKVIMRMRPRSVLGMGGYVSGPVCLAARICGRKMLLHEQNAISGWTNRVLSRFANRVMEAVPGSFASNARVVHTGNPVRKEISSIAEPTTRLSGRNGAIRILVLGGSQGAQSLNTQVPQTLAQLQQPLQVRHQAGNRWAQQTRSAYAGLQADWQVDEYIDDMAAAYAWADMVICRSGAMTIAELAAAGCASILVPFPYAVDDHQTANGEFLQQAGAAVIVAESELDTPHFSQLVSELCSDRERLFEMSVKARKVARADATSLIVEEILDRKP